MKILVLNAGSSSLKFEIFETGGRKDDLRSLEAGNFDNHGKAIKNFGALVRKIALKVGAVTAVGHRVVHGGVRFVKPVRINAAVKKEIRKLCALAPLHNPPNLACIKAAEQFFPRAVQVAVFDTAFHAAMPEKSRQYGLPRALAEKYGIWRYGFHGTSHAYVFGEARKKLGEAKTRRTVTCHLGNGCSMTAIRNGKVIDTSMGFTPLEGLPMGTRCGDLDPAIIFFLMRKGMKADEVETLLQKKSGLLGVSGISSDMRDLHAAAAKKDPRARRAMEWFCYRIAKYIGAYAAALGGLDCIVFTGGIGEHAEYVRAEVMRYVRAIVKPRVLVIPTHEERYIAKETARLLEISIDKTNLC